MPKIRRLAGRPGRLLTCLLAGLAAAAYAAAPAPAASTAAPAAAAMSAAAAQPASVTTPVAAAQPASAAKPAAVAQPAPAATTAADRTPDGTVRAFNAALSERRLAEALALLVPGAVTFQLEPAHAFAAPRPGETAPLTSDLTAHWRAVAPLLYSTHRVYLRQVDEATVHADGRLAMVWARVRTRSEPHRGTPSLLVFSETYLLRLDDGHWRIAGVAQSRSTR